MTAKKWMYYIVAEATEKGWFSGAATWAGVVELSQPLTTGEAIDTTLKWIEKDNNLSNAIIVWWTLLIEESNDNKT